MRDLVELGISCLQGVLITFFECEMRGAFKDFSVIHTIKPPIPSELLYFGSVLIILIACSFEITEQ